MSTVPEGEEQRRTPAEIESMLSKFSRADWVRARSLAAAACNGVPGWTPDDLLQEAMTKLLEGTRTCPIGIHPLVMLKNAMRSIASNERKHEDNSPIDADVAVAHFDHIPENDLRPLAHGNVSNTPYESAAARQTLQSLEQLVAGDDELGLLFLAWGEGLRGQEAMDAVGWDKAKYEAARKRLTRRLSDMAAEWSSR